MEDQIINTLKRKQGKQRLLTQKGVQADFILEHGQSILLEALQVLLESSKCDQTRFKGLLLYAQDKGFREKVVRIGGNCDQVPFAAALNAGTTIQSIPTRARYDWLISHLTIDWFDAGELISTIQKLLLPEGQLLLTAYGPQTAMRSQALLSEIDQNAHFKSFYQLQDIGDALLGAGFKEVVIESRVIKLDYQSVAVLLRDVQRVFGLNSHPDRLKGLCPKGRLTAFKSRVEALILEQGRYVEQVELLIARGRMPSAPRFDVQIPVREGRT